LNAVDFFQNVTSFFLDAQFLVLFTSTILLFIAIYIMWYFYHQQLTKKDLFETPKIDHESKVAVFFNKMIYYLKYIVVFPVYSFIWFLIFSFLLILLTKSRTVEELMFFAIVVVSVTRISAYISPLLAEDLAKLLPWALIIVFLTDPQTISFETVEDSLFKFTDGLLNVAKYLIFIAFVEWILRIGFWLFSSFGKGSRK
jgi:hypothetical protein